MKILSILTEAPHSIDQIDQKIGLVRNEITKIYSKARASGQSPQAYANKLSRLKAMLSQLNDEKKIADETQNAPEENRSFWKQQSERQFDTQLSKQRFSQATSEGQRQIRKLLKQYGSWQGLADATIKFANQTTENGRYALDVGELADHFGLTPRTLYRWLERPEFQKLRYLMPSQRT